MGSKLSLALGWKGQQRHANLCCIDSGSRQHSESYSCEGDTCNSPIRKKFLGSPYNESVSSGRRELIWKCCLEGEWCELKSCVDVLCDLKGRVPLEGMHYVQCACLMYLSTAGTRPELGTYDGQFVWNFKVVCKTFIGKYDELCDKEEVSNVK